MAVEEAPSSAAARWAALIFEPFVGVVCARGMVRGNTAGADGPVTCGQGFTKASAALGARPTTGSQMMLPDLLMHRRGGSRDRVVPRKRCGSRRDRRRDQAHSGHA